MHCRLGNVQAYTLARSYDIVRGGWLAREGGRVESERKCDISGDVRERRMHSLLAADASIDRSHTRTSTYTPLAWRVCREGARGL